MKDPALKALVDAVVPGDLIVMTDGTTWVATSNQAANVQMATPNGYQKGLVCTDLSLWIPAWFDLVTKRRAKSGEVFVQTVIKRGQMGGNVENHGPNRNLMGRGLSQHGAGREYHTAIRPSVTQQLASIRPGDLMFMSDGSVVTMREGDSWVSVDGLTNVLRSKPKAFIEAVVKQEDYNPAMHVGSRFMTKSGEIRTVSSFTACDGMVVFATMEDKDIQQTGLYRIIQRHLYLPSGKCLTEGRLNHDFDVPIQSVVRRKDNNQCPCFFELDHRDANYEADKDRALAEKIKKQIAEAKFCDVFFLSDGSIWRLKNSDRDDTGHTVRCNLERLSKDGDPNEKCVAYLNSTTNRDKAVVKAVVRNYNPAMRPGITFWTKGGMMARITRYSISDIRKDGYPVFFAMGHGGAETGWLASGQCDVTANGVRNHQNGDFGEVGDANCFEHANQYYGKNCPQVDKTQFEAFELIPPRFVMEWTSGIDDEIKPIEDQLNWWRLIWKGKPWKSWNDTAKHEDNDDQSDAAILRAVKDVKARQEVQCDRIAAIEERMERDERIEELEGKVAQARLNIKSLSNKVEALEKGQKRKVVARRNTRTRKKG